MIQEHQNKLMGMGKTKMSRDMTKCMTKLYNIVNTSSLFPKFFNFSRKTQGIERFTLIFAAINMIISPLEIAIRDDLPKKSTILFGILEWGLGHATRSVPIISALQKAGHRVVVAGERKSIQWLKKECPDVSYFELPDSGFKHIGRYLLFNIGANIMPMIRQFIEDKRIMKKLIRESGAEVIISDNRFFFRSRTVQNNIYITHQTTIFHPHKAISILLSAGHQWCIRSFNQCWIFDDMHSRLAGVLSQPENIRSFRYIGVHSRLNIQLKVEKWYDILFLISGPEPQRSIFEEKVVLWIHQHPQYHICLIRGATSTLKNVKRLVNTDVLDLADSLTIATKLALAGSIVARPGYSTLMDVKNLSIPILWVPTPGQTEQEYLGKYHAEKNNNYMSTDQRQWEKAMDIFLVKYALSDLVNR